MQTAGPDEIRLIGDSDAVVALEAKLVRTPGRSINEGTAPSFIMNDAMVGFDREIVRYAAVTADPRNPVSRPRMTAVTREAAEFLEQRARSIVGPAFDLDVVSIPRGAP